MVVPEKLAKAVRLAEGALDLISYVGNVSVRFDGCEARVLTWDDPEGTHVSVRKEGGWEVIGE